ncbi:c-type cytochrome [Consotaella aegiceratis]|uniref:c-type cytochrome n=1 Tax=Consotaella aegiceratis TaxID=3097961 RepID=UPI002F40908C
MILALGGCEDGGTPSKVELIGDSEIGARRIDDAGCGSCHIIPGIRDAKGLVGPPLDHMARRAYIAGLLRNTPGNMVSWLRSPQAIVPGNAMPDMGLSEQEARDIAAYLATLQ